MQIAQQTFSKIVLAEFSSSRVQGDMSEVNTCVEPAAHVRDDPVLHSLADRLRYFQILDRSGDSQRRLDVFGGIAPAELCLETMNCAGCEADLGLVKGRSEEHTSELQSLMRNSYAVFCLKQKQQKRNRINYYKHTT